MTEKLLDLIDACQNTGSRSDFEALRQAIIEQSERLALAQEDEKDWHHANSMREKAEQEVARLKAACDKMSEDEMPRNSAALVETKTIEVPATEANNYSWILSPPETEEEGDPVAKLAALELPPIGPHDHPEPQTLMWSKTELAAIKEYRRQAFVQGAASLSALQKISTESLSTDIQKILHDNLWELYELA